MSDDNLGDVKPEIVLTITLSPSGLISVNGPIQDKVLAYGMLEYAKDAIYDHHVKVSAKANGKRFTFLTNGH